MPDGKFIVFEGPDGSGQTTQVNLLSEYLCDKGYKVLVSHEPTNITAAGKEIIDVLQHRKTMDPWELQKLFVLDRREHLEKEILPALAEGIMVIEDRYILSTCAFGSITSPIEDLISLNEGLRWPDRTFILKVDPEISLDRIARRGKPVEFFEKREKLEKVNVAYAGLASRFPNCIVLDGERSIESLSTEIAAIVQDLINGK